MAKQIFLYKPTTPLNDTDLQALRDADFIPICVDLFDDIKVIDTLNEASRSAVWMSAMRAIAESNQSVGPRTLFGKLLAEKLSGCDIAP